MGDLAILVPVLRRPHRVQPLLDSILAAKPAHVVFVCDPDDQDEIDAVRSADSPLWIDQLMVPGGYARKINAGVLMTREPLIFLGADDLVPKPGWFEAAAGHLVDDVQVVGVNDLIPRDRDHATHFLMTRDYAKLSMLDGSQGPMPEAYAHWWCDNELIATARHRGAYTYATDAIVAHKHPLNQGAPDDETYAKGRARADEDRRIYRRRRRLWERADREAIAA